MVLPRLSQTLACGSCSKPSLSANKGGRHEPTISLSGVLNLFLRRGTIWVIFLSRRSDHSLLHYDDTLGQKCELPHNVIDRPLYSGSQVREDLESSWTLTVKTCIPGTKGRDPTQPPHTTAHIYITSSASFSRRPRQRNIPHRRRRYVLKCRTSMLLQQTDADQAFRLNKQKQPSELLDTFPASPTERSSITSSCTCFRTYKRMRIPRLFSSKPTLCCGELLRYPQANNSW